MRLTLILFTALLWSSCQQSTPETAEEPEEQGPTYSNDGGLELPENFISTIVADSTHRGARHIVVNDNGDIYVKMRSDDGKAIVGLRDTDDDGKADEQVEFGKYGGTGIDIYRGYLYASSTDEIFRYALVPEQLMPDTAGESIVSGFPEQTSHEAKSFTFDGSGNIYVNVGAPSNACMEQSRTPGSKGQDPCPQREWQGSIWRFNATTSGQTQQEDGHQYCMGIRNCVALDWDTETNSLFAVQHGRDQLNTLWPDLFTAEQNAELPAEEFLQINDGDDFGWPFCYYDQIQDVKVLSPEYGGDGSEVGRCEDKKDPILAFPGHLAPNDLLFYQGDMFPERYQQGAFIAFHGSWNRAPEPQEGYYVVFVPFENGSPSGEWEVFADGFTNLEVIESPGDAVHRPMGLAEGPDGSLYITDSVKGKIWRITYSEPAT